MPRRKDPNENPSGQGKPADDPPPVEPDAEETAASDIEEEGFEPNASEDQQPIGLSPLDLPAEAFEAGLERRKRNRAALLDWIRTLLVEGTDYGRLHLVSKARCPFAREGQVQDCPTPSHWSKPGLFKPGAEKLCGLLGVVVRFPTLAAYEQAALRGEPPIETVILRCELLDRQGHIVAEGMGARSVAEDRGDLNKTLKMACKSAHIDATLRLAGLSEVFTQDLDERSGRDASEIESELEVSGPGHAVPQLTQTQLEILELRIRRLGLDRARVLRWLKQATKGQCTTFEALTPELYGKLLTKLEIWARPRPVLPPLTGLPEPDTAKPSAKTNRPAPRPRRPRR